VAATRTETPAQEDFHRRAAALKLETRMVIDGKLVDAFSDRRFETMNPANEEIVASVRMCCKDREDKGWLGRTATEE
jgi:hypothetical protein